MNINYKSRVDKLVEKAKQKGLVKTYAQVCETTWGKESMLSEEEVKYYASSKKIVKYSIGDIVFVENYLYKSGEVGQRHIFVIVNEGEAVDINYFGFLLSSNIDKASYKYNEIINKNSKNNLQKDSIVKCDDLIQVTQEEIKFKIGTVEMKEVEKFICLYEQYLENI